MNTLDEALAVLSEASHEEEPGTDQPEQYVEDSLEPLDTHVEQPTAQS